MEILLWIVAGVLGAYVLVQIAISIVWRLQHPVVAKAVGRFEDDTAVDESGAVRSVQSADLVLPDEELARMWTPPHLERLARTYWRFLTRVTLGLIRVSYTEGERLVVLVTRPFVLLRFQAPEYELSADRGIVRWRIEKGLLVSKPGRGGDGYLEIDVSRRPAESPANCTTVHVEVEVANFYPAIASGISTWVYTATQSRIHVLVTHAFLRSLARLDLAQSRVGRYREELSPPEPPPSPVSRR